MIFLKLYTTKPKLIAVTPKLSIRNKAIINEENFMQKYRCVYFEILDLILYKMNDRFVDVERLEFIELADSSYFLFNRKNSKAGGILSNFLSKTKIMH
ncbi:hypothetical protein PGB90_003999 [Kerria lacca]